MRQHDANIPSRAAALFKAALGAKPNNIARLSVKSKTLKSRSVALKRHRGGSVVWPGSRFPAAVHPRSCKVKLAAGSITSGINGPPAKWHERPQPCPETGNQSLRN
jgi:hypothetical protein